MIAIIADNWLSNLPMWALPPPRVQLTELPIYITHWDQMAITYLEIHSGLFSKPAAVTIVQVSGHTKGTFPNDQPRLESLKT